MVPANLTSRLVTIVGARSDGVDDEIDVCREQRAGIEMVMTLEQRAPDDGGEHRRNEELREVAQARRFELAAGDTAIDQLGQRLDAARDHSLVVELGQLRMLVPFGDEQPRNEGAARADQLLDEAEEGPFEERLYRKISGLHLPADHVEMRGDDATNNRFEQLDLGLEVEIGQTLTHPGARGNVFEPRAGES